jgi:hypothetical protein
MLLAGFGALAALAALTYYLKHSASAATVAAVKAEIAKLEAEGSTDVKAVIARLKALL